MCQGLIFTACFSRHQFVWPTFSQTTEEVIRGFEAAWGYFGGVFPVVIPDNMKSIVIEAENTAPRFNDVFIEYAQSRGFVIDAARVRTPTDKPRVERVVQYAQNELLRRGDLRRPSRLRVRAETWCTETAGMRIHGTTQWRPIEAFRTEEQPLLLPLPCAPFDTPTWSDPKVHRDFHVLGGQGDLLRPPPSGRPDVEGQARLVHRQVLSAGRAGEGPSPQTPRWQEYRSRDMPTGKEIYATRDIERLQRMAADHGEAIGRYAAAMLDTPLPWTKMRQVYRLLGLVKKWGAARVDEACRRALDAEAVDVNLVSRMLERARESTEPDARPDPVVIQGRFARDASEFSSQRRPGDEHTDPDRVSRAEGPHAQAATRPAARHLARAPGAGQEPRPRPRRVLGAALQRRGDPT